MIAVFHMEDRYYAIDDFCPHQGASLAGGWVHEGCVACPWHAWRFNLEDGAWLDNPKIKVETYPVTIQGDDILVELP
jgi:nitrite reductase (NADH) small subunit